MLHIVSAHDPGLIVLPSPRLIQDRLPSPVIQLADVRRRPLPYTLERLAAAWKDNQEVWYVSRARVEAFTPCLEQAGVDGLSELAHRIVERARARGDEIAVAPTPHTQVTVSAIVSGAAAAAVLAPALEPGLVTQVADQRRTPPPKSTHFWPKPMAGLVLRALDPPDPFN